MNKRHVTLVVLALCAALAGCGGNWRCNPLREAPDTDKSINKYKKRIAELEKDPGASTRKSFGLSENYFNLGNAYMEKKLFDPAIDAFTKAIENGKRGPSVYYSLGLAYGNKGKDIDGSEDLDRAEEYFKKALEQDPGYYLAKYSWSFILFYNRGEKEKAVDMMQEVVSARPKYYRARFALGVFYYEMGMIDSSLGTYLDLRADLQKLPDSAMKKEYLERCKESIDRLMVEKTAGGGAGVKKTAKKRGLK